MDNDHQISKYDRQYTSLFDSNALRTKATVIKTVDFLRSSSFNVQTFRDDKGDHVFIECNDENGTIRLKLPPDVTRTIAAQRDSLTTRGRKVRAKAAMQERMRQGYVPTFARKKKGGG